MAAALKQGGSFVFCTLLIIFDKSSSFKTFGNNIYSPTILCMDFSKINFLAALVATVASFGLGALWYSPILFSKAWQRGVGLSDEDLKGANMGKIFGTTLVLTFLMAFGMAYFMQGTEISWTEGAMMGFFTGLFFVFPSIGINYQYQRKPASLWMIDAGYQVAFLTLIGAIIGAWS